MFFGHWEYIEGGGLGGVAKSSSLWRSIIADDIHFSFYHHASWTVRNKIHKPVWEIGKGREEGGKVAAGMIPKSYSNALSSGCRGKLETILGASNTSLEESEDRIERGGGRRNGGGQAFWRMGQRPKNIIHYLWVLFPPTYCSKNRYT